MSAPTKNELRAAVLFERVTWGLLENYPCFNDHTLCIECESVVKVPNTGNDQLDCENVRDQVVKFAKRYEQLHPTE